MKKITWQIEKIRLYIDRDINILEDKMPDTEQKKVEEVIKEAVFKAAYDDELEKIAEELEQKNN